MKKYVGNVIHGLGKGKDFGFPTVNIKLIDNNLDIESGAYAVQIMIYRDVMNCVETAHNGMLYVGTRPTLNLKEVTIEIHIFDFNEDIYDRQISFQIVHKIREEMRFNSTENLIQQLHQDKETVYNFFQNHNSQFVIRNS